MARSHLALGLASWVVAAPLLHGPVANPECVLLALGGALLPDIDHPQSWVGRRTRPLSTAISALFGHRGITHSAVAVAALAALLAYSGTNRVMSSALAVGYLSHLAADMLTPRGLRLAWPLRRTWGWPLCATGSAAEPVVVAGLCLLAAAVFLQGAAGHGVVRAAQYWLGPALTLLRHAGLAIYHRFGL